MSENSFKKFEGEKQIWNDFVDSTPYSTILQFWQWGELKKSEGWQPHRVALLDNNEIKIAAQVLLKPAPLLGNYLYVPYGPVFNSVGELEKYLPEFLTGLQSFAKENNCFVVEFDPLIGETVEENEAKTKTETEAGTEIKVETVKSAPEVLLPYLDKNVKKVLLNNGFQLSKRNFQPKYKLFYDLTKTEDELLMLMKKNTRYNVRLADKKGVEVKSYNMGYEKMKDKIDEYYDLLLETQERAKGYPIRPKSTFTTLLEVFKDEDNLKYFEAVFENDLIAANISEFTKYWASSFYGASNRLHPDTKAPYLLRWKSVLEAKQRGCKVYDFWGIIPDSGQHKGYSETKLSFGGTRMDTFGIFALPLSGWKYQVWDKLLPLRTKFG